MPKSKYDLKCPECGHEHPEEYELDVCDACGKKLKTKPDSKPKRADRISWVISGDTPEEQAMLGYSQKFTRDSSGFLSGKACVTNIGVFPYLQPDGTVIRELRLPEEVFHPDSLASLRMKPVTLDHPSVAVTPDNAKQYQVGSIGDGIETDAYHVWAPLTVTTADAIDAVLEEGKRALSCGYSCELEVKPGNYLGQDYDVIQRNIRYNHVAIVDMGRAGDMARMRLDSANRQSGVQIFQPKREEPTVSLKTHKIDGVDYQAEAKVLEALHAANQRADEAASQISTMQAKHDSAIERADAAEAKVKELEAALANAISPERLDSLVAARIALHAIALKAGVEVKADSSEDSLKREIIVKAFPKANLDGKDAAYIAARFDAAVEQIEAQAEDQAASGQGAAASEGSAPAAANTQDKADAAAARQRMIESNRDAWKRQN